MSSYRNTPAGADPARAVIHALAALREAAERLDDATAAGERPSLAVASAVAHVAAARTALKAQGVGAGHGEAERDAA